MRCCFFLAPGAMGVFFSWPFPWTPTLNELQKKKPIAILDSLVDGMKRTHNLDFGHWDGLIILFIIVMSIIVIILYLSEHSITARFNNLLVLLGGTYGHTCYAMREQGHNKIKIRALESIGNVVRHFILFLWTDKQFDAEEETKHFEI
ncbi:hypothetical protein ACJX0J_018957, partial [Zea mays]